MKTLSIILAICRYWELKESKANFFTKLWFLSYNLSNQLRHLQHSDNFCRTVSDSRALAHYDAASDAPSAVCQNKLTTPRRVGTSLISQRVYSSFHVHATRSSFIIKPRNLDEMGNVTSRNTVTIIIKVRPRISHIISWMPPSIPRDETLWAH